MALLVTLLGALAHAACAPADLQALVATSRDQLYSQQFSAALETVWLAVDAAPCHDALLAPGLLASLYQSAGVIAHYAGDGDRSAAWLETAARVAPAVPYDRALGDDGAVLYSTAKQRVSSSPTVAVHANGGILLDGWPLDAGRSRSVTSGEHFSQELGEDGTVQTEVVVLSGERVSLGEAPATLPPAVSISAPLLYSGMTLAAAGVGMSLGLGGWSWYRAGQYEPFAAYAETSAGHRRRAIVYSAAGALLIGGGAAMMVRGVSVQPADGGAVVAVQRDW